MKYIRFVDRGAYSNFTKLNNFHFLKFWITSVRHNFKWGASPAWARALLRDRRWCLTSTLGAISRNCYNLSNLCKSVWNCKLRNLFRHFILQIIPFEFSLTWSCVSLTQLQVSENYSDLTKWRSTLFKYCWLMLHFIFNMFKRWYIMC